MSDQPTHPGIAFWAKHEGHDVGLRHEDGSLLSATCHDCGETYHRSDAERYGRSVGLPAGRPS